MDLASAQGGGGARGLAHFGVLQVLWEAGFFPKTLAGTSMGAIVGGVFSVGQDLNCVLRLLSSLDLRKARGLPPSTRSVAEEAIVESLIGRIRRRPWWEVNSAILAVDVSAPLGPEPHSFVDVALCAYDITARALQEHQIRRARERLGENFLLIKPEVGHMGLLEFALLPEAVEAGRAAAQTVISELKNR